jgi:hypothetical protein
VGQPVAGVCPAPRRLPWPATGPMTPPSRGSGRRCRCAARWPGTCRQFSCNSTPRVWCAAPVYRISWPASPAGAFCRAQPAACVRSAPARSHAGLPTKDAGDSPVRRLHNQAVDLLQKLLLSFWRLVERRRAVPILGWSEVIRYLRHNHVPVVSLRYEIQVSGSRTTR